MKIPRKQKADDLREKVKEAERLDPTGEGSIWDKLAEHIANTGEWEKADGMASHVTYARGCALIAALDAYLAVKGAHRNE